MTDKIGDRPTVNVEPIGIRKDGMLIFELNLEGHGPMGPEKADELGLLDAGYEFGEFDDWLPVVEEDKEEPVKTEGYINERQPIRGELEV